MNPEGSTDRGDTRALLLTGPYGSGKSTVVDEITSVLEERDGSFAALDLDWLAWFRAGDRDGHGDPDVMLRNLDSVVRNYREIGISRFVMAFALDRPDDLERLRAVLAMPVFVVRLVVPIDVIEERLRHETTTGRASDLEEAKRQIAGGTGIGLEDVEVANDRPIRSVALDVLERAGWNRPGLNPSGTTSRR